MIVYKETKGYNATEMIEKIIYILWDAGVKLGHRVHEIDELFEVSKTDITIKTAMLESRFVEGSKYLWSSIENELQIIRQYEKKTFIHAKIEEMAKLHRRFPLTMEPNLKEGVGGFRNANLVYWIGNILYNISVIKELPQEVVDEKEYKKFRIALEFLFRVRSALHLVRKKKEDRLRLEFIPQIATYLGYENTHQGHMKFAKTVTMSLKIIKLHTTIWIYELTKDELTETENTNILRPKSSNHSLNILLQQLSDRCDAPFERHPLFLKVLSRISLPIEHNQETIEIIRNIFYKPHSFEFFQALLDTNLLGYVITPLKQVINLPQFDGYHQYSVGIHSVKAIYHIENLKDPILINIYNELSDEQKALLKIAILLHDAGKGRKEAHAQVGVRLFKKFAEELTFSPEQIRMGKNLILYHNDMSITAQQEDLNSEQTILKFAALFKTKLELDFIYLLTVADLLAVSDKIYNSFNAKLLYTLYTQSCIAISHGEKLYETSKRLRKERILKKDIEFTKLPKIFRKKVLSIPSDLLFMKYSPKRIIDISQIAKNLLEAKDSKNYHFEINTCDFLTIEVIRQENFDISYLLHKLNRLDIVNMDICKLFSGMKYFKLTFNEAIEENEISIIEELVVDSLTSVHQLNLIAPQIESKNMSIDCNHSKEYAMLRLQCANQKGLLSYLIQIFDDLEIDISSAKIHTKSDKVSDLFLIEKNGNFCHNTELLTKKIIKNL
jgi:[protein-PII] uridylyltransferase